MMRNTDTVADFILLLPNDCSNKPCFSLCEPHESMRVNNCISIRSKTTRTTEVDISSHPPVTIESLVAYGDPFDHLSLIYVVLSSAEDPVQEGLALKKVIALKSHLDFVEMQEP
ncbi:uncharacterized protein PRCAT00005229001 [Priceomyces carsonii]|uniref:uncharacterized protein n=1 Tax=Priceomyces carsonii TaxID=28549 RepID=UPI002ED92A8B|nr:unnamed protein product [Priceomyces carsonii]